MKKLLLATIATVALATSAMAFGSNGTVMPSVPSNLDTDNLNDVTGVMLECYPKVDRSDRDPVQRTNIDLTFKSGPDQHVATFLVNHTLFSGRVIDRDTQYAGNVWKKAGYNEWYWSGRQYQNPRVSMQATVLRTQRGQWQYQETVYKDGYVDHVIPSMNCTRTWGD